jgi:LacI family transcriptional regulator
MTRKQRRSRAAVDTSAPTIKQVAEQAGVSTATVSRVLAGADGVSVELSKRVRAAVGALDYQPNRIARNLRVRGTRTAGLVISDIQNPFFTSAVRGIEDVLQADGYTLLLGNSDENPARERVYLATLRAEGVAGIIVAPSGAEVSEYRKLASARVPLVVIDRNVSGLSVDVVTVANADGAHAAVAHLIGLGHRRIGLIAGPPSVATSGEREAGYAKALAAVGLPLEAELIRYADFRQGGGYAAAQALLDLTAPPTAMFVANNLMTLGALQAIHERGLRIPADIAIVGFDDMPWATSLQPPLTAVAQPTYEMGATAAQLLLARVREPDRPNRHVVLATQLIVRASCGNRML